MAISREDMPTSQKREEFDLIVKAMKAYGTDAYVSFETNQIMPAEEYNQELYNPTGIGLDDFVLVDDWIWDNIEEDE